MDRAIITVLGKDTIGIIAGVSTYLAQQRVNILDISQTIVDGFFNMMMIVDISGLSEKGLSFHELAETLESIGRDQIGVQIKCQKEEIFDQMHRI